MRYLRAVLTGLVVFPVCVAIGALIGASVALEIVLDDVYG